MNGSGRKMWVGYSFQTNYISDIGNGSTAAQSLYHNIEGNRTPHFSSYTMTVYVQFFTHIIEHPTQQIYT